MDHKSPKHPRGTPGRTLKKHEVFAPFGPNQVHPRGWTGFGWNVKSSSSLKMDRIGWNVKSSSSSRMDPKCPKHPKGTPGGTLKKHVVFAPFGPKQVHPRGWTGFGLKTREGVHREGGGGEGLPSPLMESSNTPTKVDGLHMELPSCS